VNLLADESVDAPIVERLRLDGHDVAYVAEMRPGITDDEVLDGANRSESLLLTGDKDFGELVFRLHRVNSGVVLIRLSGLSPLLKAGIVSDATRKHGREMAGAFTVISSGMVRIRHQP
jgi:predicted nuclease of predicted toxin-antitoxin system